MASLRRCRRRHALLIGLCDLGGLWTIEQVTGALSDLADRCVGLALAHLLGEAARRGEVEPGPVEELGVIVLGMGKLGAGELNFSSDIDLIVLFDPDRLRYHGGEGPMALCVRLARGLVYLLETKTKDGYVFRTDLRLRPHPPGHPLALSVEDAEIYYERHGQNWERAAMIKARTVAGDRPPAPPSSRPWRRSSGGATSTTPPSATSTRSSARSTPIAASAPSACSATI